MKRSWLIVLIALCSLGVGAALSDLPKGFYVDEENEFGGIGGDTGHEGQQPLRHLPVVLIPDEGCKTKRLFSQPDDSRRCPGDGMASALLEKGLSPLEVWALRIMPESSSWHALEDHTDDVRTFVWSVLKYTGAPKVRLIGFGAGGVLTQAAIKKYRLAPLIASVVYVDAPFGGLRSCDRVKCLTDAPICCSLTPGSTFLNEVRYASYGDNDASAADGGAGFGITAVDTVYGGLATLEPARASSSVAGARNLVLADRSSAEPGFTEILWAMVGREFLEEAQACRDEDDRDGDGYCALDRGGSDCDDTDVDVHPGAPERCSDGVDQDCNGRDFDCETGRDVAPANSKAERPHTQIPPKK